MRHLHLRERGRRRERERERERERGWERERGREREEREGEREIYHNHEKDLVCFKIIGDWRIHERYYNNMYYQWIPLYLYYVLGNNLLFCGY